VLRDLVEGDPELVDFTASDDGLTAVAVNNDLSDLVCFSSMKTTSEADALGEYFDKPPTCSSSRTMTSRGTSQCRAVI
jgi:hypothetical protein